MEGWTVYIPGAPCSTLFFKNTFQAAICRCSQPLSGFNSRCQEDETLIDIIMRTTPNASYVYIVDTRPKVHVCLSAFHLSEKASQLIPVTMRISLLIKTIQPDQLIPK